MVVEERHTRDLMYSAAAQFGGLRGTGMRLRSLWAHRKHALRLHCKATSVNLYPGCTQTSDTITGWAELGRAPQRLFHLLARVGRFCFHPDGSLGSLGTARQPADAKGSGRSWAATDARAVAKGCRFSARAATTSAATRVPSPQDDATDPSQMRDITAARLEKLSWDQAPTTPKVVSQPHGNVLGTKRTYRVQQPSHLLIGH